MSPLRVLLIAYAFPPFINAQAIRWLMLVRALSTQGVDVEVLTVQVPDYFAELTEEIPANVAVHRAWVGPLQAIGLRARAGLRLDDDWLSKRTTEGGLGAGRRLYHLARRLADAALVPDLCTEWLPFALPRAMSLARSGRFDVLLSAHEPGVDHLIAARVKAATTLPWVADFADPWINQNTPRFRRRVDRLIERRIFRHIDALTVTTDGAARAYERAYPRLAPVRVVAQGFDAKLMQRSEAEHPPGRGRLRLVYTGTLYRGLRDPAAVFEGIRLARSRGVDVTLTVAGRVPDDVIREATARGLDGIEFLGVVGFKRALALQKGADLLLHIDNVGEELQIPGKFFEYHGSGRPLMVIRHGDASSSFAATHVRRHGGGVDIENDAVRIGAALEQLALQLPAPPDPGVATQYTFERSTKPLLDAMGDALERARHRAPR